MVEVFKTNVQDRIMAKSIVAELQEVFPCWKINFDLHDCDNILRVEGEKIRPGEIAQMLSSRGFLCEVLEG